MSDNQNANILQDAIVWNEKHGEQLVSSFACRYPGQYGEAATALRQVRRQLEMEE